VNEDVLSGSHAHDLGDRDSPYGGSLMFEDFDQRRTMVVTNRPPARYLEQPDGSVSVRLDSSGVSRSYEPFKNQQIDWIVPALTPVERKITDGQVNTPQIPGRVDWNVHFVRTSRRVEHKHYNVICNPLLWFTFHRAWSSPYTPKIGREEHDAWDTGYVEVNRSFASAISDLVGSEQVRLIVQDYQQLLVPGMLRDMTDDAEIHIILDTPWPWPSDLSLLPERWIAQITDSISKADSFRLPSKQDVAAFKSCGHPVKGSIQNIKSVVAPSFQPVERQETNQQQQLAAARPGFLFVTVDRAEPNKNLVRPIEAFRNVLKRSEVLERKPEFWVILSPGPNHIAAYRRLMEDVRRAARPVNNEAKYTAVRIIEERNMSSAQVALREYDALVSVPIVDGVGRTSLDAPPVNKRNGLMILSKSLPIADLYGDHSLSVQPTDSLAIEKVMISALNMSDAERETRSLAIRELAGSNTAESFWRAVLDE